MRHNDIRDFEAAMLSKVCADVEIEPPLQPIANEVLPKNCTTSDEARLDVRARGFWRRGQNAYFDVKVTNAHASSQAMQPLRSLLAKHEREKKKSYNQRVMNIEHGTMTPLIFTVNGSMGPECAQFHRCLASKIAEKTGQSYSDIINYIRCRLSFIILRATILCLRGSRARPSKSNTEMGDDFSLYARDLQLKQ